VEFVKFKILKMKNKLLFLPVIVITVLFLASCGNGTKKDGDTKKDTVVQMNVPAFNADTAYYFVKRQVDFGPRNMGSKAHDNCARYFEQTFKKYTKNVTVQNGRVTTFDGKTFPMQNIIASFNPDNQNRIFICSHWDSRPFADQDPDVKNHTKPIDGANDGASGCGIILELARMLSVSKVKIGVDLIMLDAEDYGQPEKSTYPPKEDTWGLGSQYWSKNPHKPNYQARFGILLDMVGATSATFGKEGFSQYYAPDIVTKVWSAAARSGFGDYFIMDNTNEITDDHYYINTIRKIPTIDIIQQTPTGFNKTWHTLSDNISGIDKATLKAVGQTLVRVIWEE